MFKLTKFSQRGQSLIEVTFAAAVVGLVLVAILSLVIASLQQARRSLEQSQATQHGQTALEWIRAQRDQQGWGTFSSGIRAEGGSPLVYCWDAIPTSFAAWMSESPGACSSSGTTDMIPGTEVRREIEIVWSGNPVTSFTVTAVLERPGQDGVIENRIQTVFTDWE
jgi:Tfp pilus assembly protein PilW